MTRHLLDISALTSAQLREILELAGPPGGDAPLRGSGVCLLFEKPSARTRHSAEMAVVQLGGHPVYTREEEVGFDVRESVEDVTRVLAGYHRVLGARVRDHGTLERMAAVCDVPVVNLLSDRSHPLQAIADVLTMEAHVGGVASLRVGWLGDFNNVARSLTEAVCLLGGTLVASCPPGYGPSGGDEAFAGSTPGTLVCDEDPVRAVAGCQVIHTDTWISMGQEDEASVRRSVFLPYQVTESVMSAAAPGARFMHCMPAHRGEEVSADVFDGAASLVVPQGHARLASARAALRWVLGGSGDER